MSSPRGQRRKQNNLPEGLLHQLIRFFHCHDWEASRVNGYFIPVEEFCRKCGRYRHRILRVNDEFNYFPEWINGRHPESNIKLKEEPLDCDLVELLDEHLDKLTSNTNKHPKLVPPSPVTVNEGLEQEKISKEIWVRLACFLYGIVVGIIVSLFLY